MAKDKKKKVKPFKFTATQSEWLEQHLAGYMAAEESDPSDHNTQVTAFLENTYQEAEAEFGITVYDSKDAIMEVSRNVAFTASDNLSPGSRMHRHLPTG